MHAEGHLLEMCEGAKARKTQRLMNFLVDLFGPSRFVVYTEEYSGWKAAGVAQA